MRTVFILGGSGDIGKSIASKFSGNGYNIISPKRQELNLEYRDSVDEYFKKNKCLDIEVLIQCAGWNEPKPFEEVKYEDLDKANSINAISFYKIVQYLLPGFKKRNNGYILAISSLYGFLARGKRLPYVMSKHALNGLVKTLAIELGQYNIKVNALSPGFVDTKMTRKNNTVEVIKSFEDRIPLAKLADVNDISNVAYFLCSPENNYITGQNIIVDGGYCIGGFQK